MKLKMHDNSIFAILLRSPWWVSAAVAGGLFALGRLLFPAGFEWYAAFLALPFAVISAYTLWRQFRAPSETRVAERLEAMRALSWQDFSTALEEAYRGEGYGVKRLERAAADFELVKDGRVTVVGAKRWKVARAGIEALKELEAARAAREAHDSIYVAAGEVTEPAREFAAQKRIRLVEGAGLAQFLPRLPERAGTAAATR